MTSVALGPGDEFDRIRAIARELGQRASGLGEDCAVVPTGQGTLFVSTDASVQDVHFKLEWMTLREVGRRAAGAALSDLAAAGASPVGLLAAVLSPRDSAQDEIVELMRGVADAAEETGALVLGGDLSAGAAWAVTVTVAGRGSGAPGRGGARPGDRLWVTGALGGARAALEAWRGGRQPGASARAAFTTPVPRIAAGRWLAKHGARAMLDLSDGLAGDAAHLAAASGLALQLQLESVPLAPDVIAEARALDVSPQQFAAEGGEDYELLAALPPEFDAVDAAEFTLACDLALTRVGTASDGAGVVATLDGKPLSLRGYDHFR